MTKQEKQLLLKDLCARLLYHPRVRICNDSWEGCKIGEFDNDLWFHHIEAFNCSRIEILPYLRPMSSMTEEEASELDAIKTKYKIDFPYGCTSMYQENIDYLNSHYFDYRGLIEKGLALEAPEGMYKL